MDNTSRADSVNLDRQPGDISQLQMHTGRIVPRVAGCRNTTFLRNALFVTRAVEGMWEDEIVFVTYSVEKHGEGSTDPKYL